MKHAFLLLVALLLATPALHADVKMPSVFGSHMVLQQDSNIPVWGWAEPGEQVSVTMGENTTRAVADAHGNWRVDLPPAKTESKPQTLTVAGKNTIRFEDVLVGDVWVCSGQSNMGFNFKYAHNAAGEMPKANEPQLRLFFVRQTTALEPQRDVGGQWVVCTPGSSANFSAVGYFFGKELCSHLKRPVGMIGTYWGGSKAQSWTSLSGLQKNPPFSDYIADHEKLAANFTKATAEYPQKLAAYQDALKKWTAQDKPSYDAAMNEWKLAAEKAKAAHQAPPRAPVPAHKEPEAPPAPDGGPRVPVNLFNGMVSPLIPFAIKGVIWYQGESNVGVAEEYATLFPRMIADWREKWDGDFPFLFVQLPNFNAGHRTTWPLLREAQLKTLSLPKTGMAVAVDVGEGDNLHPRDKFDVAHRLALAARHVAYGEDIVYSGPMYDAMKIDGSNIVLTFKHVGSGLSIGASPWSPTGDAPATSTELKGFMIAGEDRKWTPAAAKISGDAVVVSSSEVSKPVAVRYGWENNPACNLYNKERLPASPFRTDDWQEVDVAPKK